MASVAAPAGWRVWLAGARPRTLPAAVVPVLVGTACAAGRGDVVAWRGGAAGVVALALQVGTNYANDYSDGIRGTDRGDRRVGPVRLVGSGLRSPGAGKRAALASFLVAGGGGGARGGCRRRLVLPGRAPPLRLPGPRRALRLRVLRRRGHRRVGVCAGGEPGPGVGGQRAGRPAGDGAVGGEQPP